MKLTVKEKSFLRPLIEQDIQKLPESSEGFFFFLGAAQFVGMGGEEENKGAEA